MRLIFSIQAKLMLHTFHAQVHNKRNFIDNSTLVKLAKNIANIFLLPCNKTLEEIILEMK